MYNLADNFYQTMFIFAFEYYLWLVKDNQSHNNNYSCSSCSRVLSITGLEMNTIILSAKLYAILFYMAWVVTVTK